MRRSPSLVFRPGGSTPTGCCSSGSDGTWRFSESDPTTWERIPASTDPVVLMRQ